MDFSSGNSTLTSGKKMPHSLTYTFTLLFFTKSKFFLAQFKTHMLIFMGLQAIFAAIIFIYHLKPELTGACRRYPEISLTLGIKKGSNAKLILRSVEGIVEVGYWVGFG